MKQSYSKEKELLNKNNKTLLRDFIELKLKHIHTISETETKILKYRMTIKKITLLKDDYEAFIQKYNEAQEKLVEKNKKRFSFFN